MRDITKTEAKRVRKLLSALINFAKFREMQLAGVDAVLERTETTQAQLSKVEAENAELAARLEAARADKAAEAPMLESLQAEVDGLLEQLHEMNAQQQQLQHDSRDAKDQCTELTDSEASLIFEIKAIQQEWCVPPQPSPLRAPARCRQQSRAASVPVVPPWPPCSDFGYLSGCLHCSGRGMCRYRIESPAGILRALQP